MRSKFLTANINPKSRYEPYVFTETGIYMLMTVLNGELATRQSKALVRTFKQMKDYLSHDPLLSDSAPLLEDRTRSFAGFSGGFRVLVCVFYILISAWVEKNAELRQNMQKINVSSVRNCIKREDMRKKKILVICVSLIMIILVSCCVAGVAWKSKTDHIDPGSYDLATETGVDFNDITPVTWEVSADHLMIDTDEARALYNRLSSGYYPTLEELENDPVVRELDRLSAYYSSLYGDTSKINTPERKQLREEILKEFLLRGSARKDHVNESGSPVYVYDGPLKYEYKAEIVMGLPASGKSTRRAAPDSEAFCAFNLDSDVIKGMLPEYKESHGAAAQSVHQESRDILDNAVKEFTEGDKKGCNVIIQTTGNDMDALRKRYIDPFEKGGL